jgi:zinc transporter ZupT
MIFQFIQSNFMLFFAIAILFMLFLSELIAPDYDSQDLQPEKKKRFWFSWLLGIVAWMLGMIFFVIFVTSI